MLRVGSTPGILTLIIKIRCLPPVNTKNPVRPRDYMIWRSEVMDLTRFEDRRPAIEGRVRAAMKVSFIGQVSTWVSITLGL